MKARNIALTIITISMFVVGLGLLSAHISEAQTLKETLDQKKSSVSISNKDSDDDGVVDADDKCPNTPTGVIVDANGCPVNGEPGWIDSDHDGVPDFYDLCPGTPAGTPVNTTGCPLH